MPLTATRRVSRRVLSRLRSLWPEPVPSLQFAPDVWDKEYSRGQWDYLSGLSEFGRYAIVAGYVRHLHSNPEVLEIGCGTGILHDYLKQSGYHRYMGVDLSSKAIDAATARVDESTEFAAADGGSFVDGRRYDVIVFNESLYYFDDCIAVLEHYLQALNPGGWFVISMVIGPQSLAHWKRIEQRFRIADAVKTTNRAGITWDCRIIQPVTSAASSA